MMNASGAVGVIGQLRIRQLDQQLAFHPQVYFVRADQLLTGGHGILLFDREIGRTRR
jgi:hypothetical protein